MATSANVTHYGVKVGDHRQHHLCKTHWEKLDRFQPASEHTIASFWADEDEVIHEGEVQCLDKFLKGRAG